MAKEQEHKSTDGRKIAPTKSGRVCTIRNITGRSATNISATSVEVGTKMAGQDGQMYIVKLRSNGTQYWQPCSQKTANC